MESKYRWHPTTPQPVILFLKAGYLVVSYSWTIYVPTGYTSTSTLTGFFFLSTGETRHFYVDFTAAASYNVTFTESGLSSGTSWNVTLDGTNNVSTSPTITFTGKSNGNYAYTIYTPSGYVCGSAPNGTITVSSNVNWPVTFGSVSGTDWPMRQHSNLRSSYSESAGPTTNEIQRTFATGDVVSSSAAIVNGVVYVGTDSLGMFAFDASNGDVIWNNQDLQNVASSPASSTKWSM